MRKRIKGVHDQHGNNAAEIKGTAAKQDREMTVSTDASIYDHRKFPTGAVTVKQHHGAMSSETVKVKKRPADSNRAGMAKKTKKKKRAYSLFKRMALIAAAFCIALSAFILKEGLSIYASSDLSVLGQAGNGKTVLYDRHGEPFAELTNAKVEYVTLDRIPQHMRDAIVAIEDERFYHHFGVDPVSIMRAAYQNIAHGGIVQGGSTITQQLAKNMFFTAEQTFSRKFQEAVAAVKIEQMLDKDEILERYLNYIYFGEGVWGIQNAAQLYFGKNTEQLTLAESALLAALPKAPTHYSPYRNVEKAKARRNLVLSKMEELGYITKEEADAAKAEEIVLNRDANNMQSNRFPSYVDYAIAEVEQQLELTEAEILSGGLRIYTGLDPKVQKAAEDVYRNPGNFPENKGGLQSGIALVDPSNGAVRGLVGTIGEKKQFRDFNYASQTARQPGSSIKPLAVYAPALEKGYRPHDMILDAETDFGNYAPRNYGGREHGWVTIEEALIHSYNIPAAALLKEIGVDYGMAFARKAGLPLASEDRHLGIALGGMARGVSPLQMAQAYTAFANGGVLSEAYAVVKVEDASGRVLYERQPRQVQLMKPETAYEMTKMMEKVIQQGTGTAAKLGRPAAGKTGTTQLPDIPEFRDSHGRVMNGVRDAWFVGYTPQLVGAIWLGYPNTDREHYLSSGEGRYPAQIFQKVMSAALEGEPVMHFAAPKEYSYDRRMTVFVNGEPPKWLRERERRKWETDVKSDADDEADECVEHADEFVNEHGDGSADRDADGCADENAHEEGDKDDKKREREESWTRKQMQEFIRKQRKQILERMKEDRERMRDRSGGDREDRNQQEQGDREDNRWQDELEELDRWLQEIEEWIRRQDQGKGKRGRKGDHDEWNRILQEVEERMDRLEELEQQTDQQNEQNWEESSEEGQSGELEEQVQGDGDQAENDLAESAGGKDEGEENDLEARVHDNNQEVSAGEDDQAMRVQDVDHESRA